MALDAERSGFCYTRRVLSRVRPTARTLCAKEVGEWLSLVEHLVRDQGVGGSNPLSPTIFFNHLQKPPLGPLEPYQMPCLANPRKHCFVPKFLMQQQSTESSTFHLRDGNSPVKRVHESDRY